MFLVLKYNIPPIFPQTQQAALQKHISYWGEKINEIQLGWM